jgi:hypothetical protein
MIKKLNKKNKQKVRQSFCVKKNKKTKKQKNKKIILQKTNKSLDDKKIEKKNKNSFLARRRRK